jgi:hypothetical protein
MGVTMATRILAVVTLTLTLAGIGPAPRLPHYGPPDCHAVADCGYRDNGSNGDK